MNEVAVTFGPAKHLLGVYTGPEKQAQSERAIVLLNAGVIHRVGPHRFNVKLARHLAGLGFSVLRFDLAGLGDSKPAAQAATYTEQAVADIKAAVTHALLLSGAKQASIVGICSGAENGLAAALADERISGLFMIDGRVFPTPHTQAAFLKRKLAAASAASLAKAATNKLFGLGRKLQAAISSSGPPVVIEYETQTITESIYAGWLEKITSRGARVFMVFTGSMLHNYSYADQIKDSFSGQAFLAGLDWRFLPEIDHTLTLLSAQKQMLELVSTWLAEN
ncbi:MAG: alpha/beta fold hydrolase [Burkholderiaceae bacterium]